MKRIGLLLLLLVFASSSVLAQNKVLSLDGDGDYVQIPASVWFNGDLTIEAWVYVKEYRSWSRLIDFGNGADRDNVLVTLTREATGIPGLHIVKSGGLESSTALELDNWTHIAFTLKGNSSSLFINGHAVGQGNFASPPRDVERQKNFIGRSNWRNDDAQAMFDEIRIWNLARSATEIQDAMNTSLSGDEKGLLGYWNFDNGTAEDLTANGHDGELKGDAQIVASPPSLVMANRITNLGHQFEFDVSIQNAAEGDTLAFDLTYDPLLLQVDRVTKNDATTSWQEPKINHHKGVISLVQLSHSRVISRFQSKLVTITFQSLQTGQSQVRIKQPQLIKADGRHKSVEVVAATIKAFPQANLIQALKKLDVKDIFATKIKPRSVKIKKRRSNKIS